MNKRTYCIILSLITLVCIIIGCGRYVFRWSDGFWSWGFGKREQGNQELDSFVIFDADLSVCNFKLERGESYAISYDCSEQLVPAFEVKDGILTVTQAETGIKWRGNTKCDIRVTVPLGVTLEEVSVDANVGDVDIKEIDTKRFYVQMDVGDLDVEKCSLGDADVTGATGDVDLESCLFDDLWVSLDVGNVEIESAHSLADYNMEIEVDMGEVSVNGEKRSHSYSREGSGRKLTIMIACGDADVKD